MNEGVVSPVGQTIRSDLATLRRDPQDRAAMESLLGICMGFVQRIVMARTSLRASGRDSRSIHPAIAEEVQSLTIERMWKTAIPYLVRKYDPDEGADPREYLFQQVRWMFQHSLNRAVRRSLIWMDYAQRTQPGRSKEAYLKTKPLAHVGVAHGFRSGGISFLSWLSGYLSTTDGIAAVDARSSVEHLTNVSKAAALGAMGVERPIECPYGERTPLAGPWNVRIYLNSMAVRRPTVALQMGLYAMMEGLELRRGDEYHIGNLETMPTETVYRTVMPCRTDSPRRLPNAQNAREGFVLAASAAIAAARLRLIRDARKRSESTLSHYINPGRRSGPKRIPKP